MKILRSYLILNIVLLSFGALAQVVPIEQLKPTIHSGVTPEGLTEELDLASANSQLYFHAKDYLVNQELNTVKPDVDGYYYKIKADELNIRVFLQIEALPYGDTLFLITSGGKKAESIYNDNLNQTAWSSILTYNNEVTLYYKNTSGKAPQVKIISYSLEVPKSVNGTEDFGDSGPCEVNVNCPEGTNYKDVSKSVAKILIKNGSLLSWCTGALVNNTARDCRLLFMTAEHCGYNQSNNFVNSSDLDKWIFYFNYETPTCANVSLESQLTNIKRTTGAELLARSDDNGGDDGSDFILLELNTLPINFEPYFAGWNRKNSGPASGVVIHQPQGDVKKISTFGSQAKSSEYGTTNVDTHWEVNWIKTVTNHGVTEGGSSGSPLLDANSLITGMLTGGSASCNALNASDYFGKISYSWTSNGTANNRRLAPWLDPANTGEQLLAGSFCGDSNIVITSDISVYPTLFNYWISNSPLVIAGGVGLGLIDVQIFDVQGKLKYQTGQFQPKLGENKEIDISRFGNGFYFVRIVGKSIHEVEKIMIINAQ